jgi:putative restriction endonuclease
MACGFNFEGMYGDPWKGFIHVHHKKPMSESGPTRINPQTDMSVLCPNCHAMVHRKKDQTLSLEALRDLLRKNAHQKDAQVGN